MKCVWVISRVNYGLMICRHYAAKKSGIDVRRGGRPATLSPEGKENLRAKGESADPQQDSFVKSKFKKDVIALMKKEAAARNENPMAVKPPSAKTITRLLKELLPEKVNKPADQNDRRWAVSAESI